MGVRIGYLLVLPPLKYEVRAVHGLSLGLCAFIYSRLKYEISAKILRMLYDLWYQLFVMYGSAFPRETMVPPVERNVG